MALDDARAVEEALRLAGRGWRVLPLHHPTPDGCSCANKRCSAIGKHPRLRSAWPARASANPDVIREWWQRWPAANVGIATGRGSGVVALDVDPRHGGDDTLRDLELCYAALPETPRTLTGGGGAAVLFRAPARMVRNSAGQLGAGLDVRGEGGLVVMPPSVHDSGLRYEWECDPDDVVLAELPPWLAALLAQRAATSRQERPLDAPIPEGQRNATLVRMAGAMRRAGFGVEAVRAGLLRENAASCVPPLPEREVEGIARKAGGWASGRGTDALSLLSLWGCSGSTGVTTNGLGVQERMILVVLAAHASADGICWPGYRRIEELSGVHRRYIRRALERLEAAGALEIVQRSRHGNRYRVVAAGNIQPAPLTAPKSQA